MVELDLRQELMDYADSDGDISIDELPEGFDLIEEGDWVQEYKYQHSSSIIQHKETGRLFSICRNRIGSYHSDWYYSAASVLEVKEVKVVKTTIEYHAV